MELLLAWMPDIQKVVYSVSATTLFALLDNLYFGVGNIATMFMVPNDS